GENHRRAVYRRPAGTHCGRMSVSNEPPLQGGAQRDGLGRTSVSDEDVPSLDDHLALRIERDAIAGHRRGRRRAVERDDDLLGVLVEDDAADAGHDAVYLVVRADLIRRLLVTGV